MGGITTLRGHPVLAGTASGEAVVADTPLSFWGGYDPETGEIIDRRHPLAGVRVAGRVLVIPAGRGSCSGSGVLLEAIRHGVAPDAIVTSQLDPIISLGAILGDELIGAHPVIMVVTEDERRIFRSGDPVAIDRTCQITITHAAL